MEPEHQEREQGSVLSKFDIFRRKGSQKLLFILESSHLHLDDQKRGANTVPCLSYLRMSQFDSLVWKSQKIKMTCYRSAGGNAVVPKKFPGNLPWD